VMLQITQPTVNELGGSRRRAAGEVVHLRKHDGIAASGGVASNATAIDAAPDDQQIHYFFGHICSGTASSNKRHRQDTQVLQHPGGVCHTIITKLNSTHSYAMRGYAGMTV